MRVTNSPIRLENVLTLFRSLCREVSPCTSQLGRTFAESSRWSLP